MRPLPRGWRLSTSKRSAHGKSNSTGCQAPLPRWAPTLKAVRFPPAAGGTGSRAGVGVSGKGGHSDAMWPNAEIPRAEPRPEAGPPGGGSRRSSNISKLPAPPPAVTREPPSFSNPRRSSAIPVPGSPNEVGRRLGIMTRAGMERWRDRLALVTGASGGIGAAVARALVQQGLKVVGCARTVGNIEVRLRWAAGTLSGDVVSTG